MKALQITIQRTPQRFLRESSARASSKGFSLKLLSAGQGQISIAS